MPSISNADHEVMKEVVLRLREKEKKREGRMKKGPEARELGPHVVMVRVKLKMMMVLMMMEMRFGCAKHAQMVMMSGGCFS